MFVVFRPLILLDLSQSHLPPVPNDLGQSSGLGADSSLRWCDRKWLPTGSVRPTACPKNLSDTWSFLFFLLRLYVLKLPKSSAECFHRSLPPRRSPLDRVYVSISREVAAPPWILGR